MAQHTASLINAAGAYQAQRRKAEELAELDRAKTVFFAHASHELRTPLTLIMGPLAELQARLAGQDETVQRNLDVIHRNGLPLEKLVNALLDFSRIEAGRMRARFEPVNLSVLTADLASVFRSADEKAGLRHEVDCPPLPGPVHVDREMWEEMVLNLLSNALKFTFDGGITVSLREEDGQTVLRVADTGIGVPAMEVPRLFERFHRIPACGRRARRGGHYPGVPARRAGAVDRTRPRPAVQRGGPGPAGVAERLSSFCAVLEGPAGQLTYSSAGHPPGILAHPDGRVELLDDGHSISLAIQPGMRRSDATRRISAGATLLLYTDGLVERRRRPLTAGIAAAGAVVRVGRSAPVQALAGQIMAELAPPGGFEDDVALVLYRHPAVDVAVPQRP